MTELAVLISVPRAITATQAGHVSTRLTRCAHESRGRILSVVPPVLLTLDPPPLEAELTFALLHCWQLSHNGMPITSNSLAQATGFHKAGAASRAIAGLKRRGWLTRVESPARLYDVNYYGPQLHYFALSDAGFHEANLRVSALANCYRCRLSIISDDASLDQWRARNFEEVLHLEFSNVVAVTLPNSRLACSLSVVEQLVAMALWTLPTAKINGLVRHTALSHTGVKSGLDRLGRRGWIVPERTGQRRERNQEYQLTPEGRSGTQQLVGYTLGGTQLGIPAQRPLT